MKAPEPTIREGLFYLVLAVLAMVVITHGGGCTRLPGSADFRVASR